jgi:Uncharacterized conserved protein, contains S4-like domain
MQKEELLLQKRLIELSNLAYQRNITTYSDFLNLNELNILQVSPKNLFPSGYETFGGYAYAERQMVSFLPDAFSCTDRKNDAASHDTYHYPIQILKIRPLQKKFSDKLTHRDYLGAILNLGTRRNKIGDIVILENETLVFVHNSIADFIKDSLSRIKHTSVSTELTKQEEVNYTPRYEEITGTVSSVRLDSLLSLAFPLSRSKLTGLITGGKVFVGGKLITTNAYKIKESDIISVRGMGKFMYYGVLSQTKKGRLYIQIHKYK